MRVYYNMIQNMTVYEGIQIIMYGEHYRHVVRVSREMLKNVCVTA